MLGTYHGYTNKPTWLVMAWLSDDREESEKWHNLAQQMTVEDLAATIKEYVVCEKNPVAEPLGLYEDLMSFVFAWVEWMEVADYFMEE